MYNSSPQYLDGDGNIRMCQLCKSVKILETGDWVLDTVLFVEPPENVVFEVCPKCSDKE
ncbi:MAG: hypothetical protein HND53_08440 [Proteobacteria bacterium]|nr:hypothetical protein [Pseudomonadota bacterium]